MPLPTVPDPSAAWMMRFEALHGHRASLAALRRALGWGGLLRAGLGVARRQALGPDPLAALGPDDPDDIEDWLARRQLRPLLWLDAALQDDLRLADDVRMAALETVVSATGATFLGALFPRITPEQWQGATDVERLELVRRTFRRFGNIAEAEVHLREDGVAFDVLRCRFHRMVAELGRPELGPLFCKADGVFFSRPDAPYGFTRSTTRAGGGAVCDFDLTWRG